MDAARALAELTEIAPQIELVAVFDAGGEPVASTLGDDAAAQAAARSLIARGVELFARAEQAGQPRAPGALTQVELGLAEGSVLLVREGELRALAITSPNPIAGLAFFDLMMCLRKIAGIEPKPSRLRLPGRKGKEG